MCGEALCVGVGLNKPYVWEAARVGEGTLMCSRGEVRRATAACMGEGRGSRRTGRAARGSKRGA